MGFNTNVGLKNFNFLSSACLMFANSEFSVILKIGYIIAIVTTAN